MRLNASFDQLDALPSAFGAVLVPAEEPGRKDPPDKRIREGVYQKPDGQMYTAFARNEGAWPFEFKRSPESPMRLREGDCVSATQLREHNYILPEGCGLGYRGAAGWEVMRKVLSSPLNGETTQDWLRRTCLGQIWGIF